MYSASLDSTGFSFLDQDLVDVFQQRAGQDITTALDTVLNAMNETYRAQHTACLTNVFLAGEADFRKSARCQVQNYFLIIISGILISSILIKCAYPFYLTRLSYY